MKDRCIIDEYEYFFNISLHIDRQSNIFEHVPIIPENSTDEISVHSRKKFRKSTRTLILHETLDISRGRLLQSRSLKNSPDGNSNYSDEFLYTRRWYRFSLIVSRCTPLIVSSIHRA